MVHNSNASYKPASKKRELAARAPLIVATLEAMCDSSFEKNLGLSPEEKEICRRYRVFMRFHTKEEHQELLKTVIEEPRIRRRIEELQRAIEEGTYFIEMDILVSKDGVLMSHHDVTLDETTDVLEYKEFADRVKTYEVEGANMTGLFIFDFTLKELKTLKAR